MRYMFPDLNPLKEISDTFGNRLMIFRASGNSGAITGLVSYPSGRWISLTNTNGVATSVTDELGRTVNYTYESIGSGRYRLKTVTDPNQVGQPSPKSTSLTWDPSTVVNDNPSLTPSPGTYLDTIVDPRGNTVLQNHFDPSGRVDQQTMASGRQWLYDYTGGAECAGSVKVTDPNGNKQCLGFDASTYTSTDTRAVGTADQRTFTYQRDATSHRISTMTDSFHSRVTSYAYDAMGNVQTVTRMYGTGSAETTTYDWSNLGRLKSVSDPLSHQTTFGYDAIGCLTSITDALTNQTTSTCNRAGQTATMTYAGTGPNRTTTFAYAHGDLVSLTDPLGRVTKRFVDAGGRLLSMTDPLGYRTRSAYDALGNLQTLTDARGKSTSFLYDEDSNLTRITDALLHQTNFAYYPTNLLQTKTDALTHSDSYAYDLKGNMILKTDRKNQVTEYRYNAYDRPTFIGYKRQGSPGSYTYESTVTLGYDGGWRLQTVTDTATGAGTITRGYDDLDRLTSDQQPQGSVSYTYWSDDRRKTMTAGNQPVTNYTWFANGLLQQIGQGTSSVGFTYFPSHLPQTTTLPGGQVETDAYDAANELSSIAYSGSGVPASSQVTYGYDPDGRRAGAWDSFANVGLPAATTANAVYNAANHMTSWNGVANTYDLNGNLTGAGTQTYTWNARDQLTATSGGTSSFIYDGVGRRIKKVVSGTTTKFLYDGLNPVQEQNNGGTMTANLITGLGIDQTYQRTVSGVSYNFLDDALGSTLALASAGTLSQTFIYEPYGASTQTGSGTHPYRFTGREWDGATGLQYNRARYYNPTWGRFVSEDPVGWMLGPNSYRYTDDDPLAFIDPLGLDKCRGFFGCLLNDLGDIFDYAAYVASFIAFIAVFSDPALAFAVGAWAIAFTWSGAAASCLSSSGSCGTAMFGASVASMGLVIGIGAPLPLAVVGYAIELLGAGVSSNWVQAGT